MYFCRVDKVVKNSKDGACLLFGASGHKGNTGILDRISTPNNSLKGRVTSLFFQLE